MLNYLLPLRKGRLALGKFESDCLWNFISLILLGVTGIVLNLMIARYYGADILGTFNQVFAVYIILSQFAAGGFYFSVLKFISEYNDDLRVCGKVLCAGLILVFCSALLTCLACYAMSSWLGRFFDSPGVAAGIRSTIAGLFFFALNKIILAALNGLRQMKLYALSQALRFLFLLLALVVVCLYGLDGELLPVIFSIAEIALFFFLIVKSLLIFRRGLFATSLGWVEKHIKFACKAMASGILLDVNTRVDVLVLAYFCSDRLVGVYSLAAFFAEGMYQIPVVVQSNLNPILTRVTIEKRFGELNAMVAKSHKYLLKLMVLIGLILCLIFPVMVGWFTGTAEFAESWLIFVILASGIVLYSGYLPFQMILSQAGHPGYFTLFLVSIVATNFVLNVAMIPVWQDVGAAVATAMTFLLSIVYLKMFTRGVLNAAI